MYGCAKTPHKPVQQNRQEFTILIYIVYCSWIPQVSWTRPPTISFVLIHSSVHNLPKRSNSLAAPHRYSTTLGDLNEFDFKNPVVTKRYLGLYLISLPVQKYGKFSHTVRKQEGFFFYFQKCLEIEKKNPFFFNFFSSRFFFCLFIWSRIIWHQICVLWESITCTW